jgi:hypothetical protein
MKTGEKEVTKAELKLAYQRTGLNRIGYSFEKALQCELTKKCLVRIALNAQNKVAKQQALTIATNNINQATQAISQKQYWWQEI